MSSKGLRHNEAAEYFSAQPMYFVWRQKEHKLSSHEYISAFSSLNRDCNNSWIYQNNCNIKELTFISYLCILYYGTEYIVRFQMKIHITVLQIWKKIYTTAFGYC